MINIYNAIEDLNCTDFYKHKKRLKELIDEAVSDFLNSKKIEYEYVSNCHIVFEEEQEEELEEEINNILDEVYESFIEELEGVA